MRHLLNRSGLIVHAGAVAVMVVAFTLFRSARSVAIKPLTKPGSGAPVLAAIASPDTNSDSGENER